MEFYQLASMFKHNNYFNMCCESRLAYTNFSINFPLNLSIKFIVHTPVGLEEY